MKRAHKRSKPRKPSVSVIRASGGKRKGKSMKRNSSTFRSGTVTRSMLQDAPQDALALVNGAGRVKMLTYIRKES